MLFELSLVQQEGSEEEVWFELVKTYEGSRFSILVFSIEHKNILN